MDETEFLLSNPETKQKLLRSIENVKQHELQKGKNQKAIDFIDKLLSEDSDYDKKVWPIVKEDIEKYRLSYRKRFEEK